MVDLKRSEIRAIEEAIAFPRGFGYVLDFSDRTMEEFFTDEFGIEIYDEKYQVSGSSKRNCLITFLKLTDSNTALKVLNELWEMREDLLSQKYNHSRIEEAKAKSRPFKKVIERLESAPSMPVPSGVDTYTNERTLEELVANIERTMAANKPEVALDHLHTYCVKKFTYLLKIRGIECGKDEPLHSRFGKYRKLLVEEQELHDFSARALKASISLLESFNDLRNNHSLAHDNELLGTIEARYIFNSICAVLELIKSLEASKYDE